MISSLKLTSILPKNPGEIAKAESWQEGKEELVVLLQQMSRRIADLENQVLQHESKVGAAMEIGMDALLRTKEARAIAVSSMRQTCKVRSS